MSTGTNNPTQNPTVCDDILDGIALIEAYRDNDVEATIALLGGVEASEHVVPILEAAKTLLTVLDNKPSTSVQDAVDAVRQRCLIERDRV